jgi:hypothetical protein
VELAPARRGVGPALACIGVVERPRRLGARGRESRPLDRAIGVLDRRLGPGQHDLRACSRLGLGLRVAEVACPLRSVGLDRDPDGRDPGESSRVLGAVLDPIERLVDDFSCGRRVALAGLELGGERSDRGDVLRLDRGDELVAGALERIARRRNVAAAECLLGVAEEGVGERRSPKPTAGRRNRGGGRPIAELECDLRAQQSDPQRRAVPGYDLGGGASDDLRRLLGATDDVDRVGVVDVSGREIVVTAAAAGELDRLAQQLLAALLVAERKQGGPEAVEDAGADVGEAERIGHLERPARDRLDLAEPPLEE